MSVRHLGGSHELAVAAPDHPALARRVGSPPQAPAPQFHRARRRARRSRADFLRPHHRQDGPRCLHHAGPLMADALLAAPGKNRNIAGILLLFAVAMVGAAYAAVPLYYAFCAATGYNGTTRRAEANPKGVIARDMTVRFDANVDGNVPWQITPAKPVSFKVGEVETAVFIARNLSDKPVT